MRRNICAILLVFILLLSGCATTMVGVSVISYPEGRPYNFILYLS